LSFAELIYDKLVSSLKNTKVFIVYGDGTLTEDYKIVQDKYLILNVGDYYEDLSSKTLKMFEILDKHFPDCTGCFKCDDDIVPNITSINNHIDLFSNNPTVKYAGRVSHNPASENFGCHYGKVHDANFNISMRVPDSNYCCGPLYYVNRESIRVLSQCEKRDFIIAEDICVGYYLNHAGIFPERYQLYTDNFHELNTISFQNGGTRYNIDWDKV
jgi:hypothetical protein